MPSHLTPYCTPQNPPPVIAQGRLTALYNEPMSLHTTFKTGGPADVYIPIGNAAVNDVAALFLYARENGIPLQIIGGGANLVVADCGIRGITVDTRIDGKPHLALAKGTFTVPAGIPCDWAAELAALRALSGLEFMASLPGTVGGAVWMNARCWGRQVSDVLRGVEVLDGNFNPVFEPFNAAEWGYKQSPYQKKNTLILSASFNLAEGEQPVIRALMAEYRLERERRGHFRYPSAGSVFKNNPAFGKSAGKIIDELGLRGLQIGGARIADWHGNFIVNTGGATSSDIRALTLKIEDEARSRLGIELEPEILFLEPREQRQ